MSATARILVVDDDRILRDTIQLALSFEYEVELASCGSQALEALARQPVDLVLLDFLLPDCTGLALLWYLKRRYQSLSVIFMTAYGSERVTQWALRGGAIDYLIKPFDATELLTSVTRALGARQQEGPARVPKFMADGPAPPLAGRDLEDAPVFRALSYMERNHAAPLTRDAVAHAVGISPGGLSRALRRVVRANFKGLLTRIRVSHAMVLLRNPRLSVTDVALQVGFKHEEHFSRVFRKITGQTPSAYRREVFGASPLDLPASDGLWPPPESRPEPSPRPSPRRVSA